jgi:hypothetical protein
LSPTWGTTGISNILISKSAFPSSWESLVAFISDWTSTSKIANWLWYFFLAC